MNREERVCRHCRRSPMVLSIALFLSVPAVAEDWPQFGRDRTRNAVSPERHAPTNWSFGRYADTKSPSRVAGSEKNIKWSARLGSMTCGDPVVVDGLVWVGTNNTSSSDRNQLDASVLACFRESDGKPLYRYVSPRLSLGRVHDWPHSSMACSPLVENDRLWMVTNRAEVVCLDIAPLKRGDGEPKRLWSIDLMADFGVFPLGSQMTMMHLCSIAGFKEYLYVNTGHGVDYEKPKPARPEVPSLLCLRKDTGAVVWQDNSPGENILGGQWSSPAVVEINGRAQCIAAQGDGWVRSFDALSGQPIWQFDINRKDGRWSGSGDTRDCMPASPVFANNRIYIGLGGYVETIGDSSGRLVCIDPAGQGDISSELAVNAEGKVIPHRRVQAIDQAEGEKAIPNPNSGLVWEFTGSGDPEDFANQMHRTLSNVAVDAGLLIAPDYSGIVHCLDAKTGEHYWSHDLLQAILASPLIVDGKVYVVSEDGTIAIYGLSADRNRAMHRLNGHDYPLHQISADTMCYCSPIFANGVLYVATRAELFAMAAGLDEPNLDLAGGYWPQWRGPSRDNISQETGLLHEWAAEGPSRLWSAEGLGEGIASLSIANGKIFTLGYQRESEFAIALDERTGELCWAARLGPMVPENALMRWLSQRVPAVDDDHVYAFTSGGDLICLGAGDGQERWRKNYTTDFGAPRPVFGFYEQPLVDDGLLICTPGGSKGQLAILYKRTGEVRRWAGAPSAAGARKDYVATIVAEVAGVRQYVTFLDQQLTGIAADDGRVLWRYEHLYRTPANSQTPILRGNEIFCSAPYGQPAALLTLTRNGNDVAVTQVYQRSCGLDYFQDSTVLIGEHLFATAGNTLKCLDWRTGEVVWQERIPDAGRLCFTYADGHLYVRGSEGKMSLVEATSTKLVSNGSFDIPDHVKASGATTPVVAGGRMYLRENSRLHCYDVRAQLPARAAEPRAVTITVPPQSPQTAKESSVREHRPPNGIFVPTPHDVVRRMLELAQLAKSEVVCDLGCGDGRIVIAAAKDFECRSIGFEIDRELVAIARQQAEKDGVDKLVSIERADVLTADISQIDVVTLYLLPQQNEALIPQLQRMKPGSRVVSHQFPLKGMKADRTEVLRSEESGEEHTIYLYKLPLTAAE